MRADLRKLYDLGRRQNPRAMWLYLIDEDRVGWDRCVLTPATRRTLYVTGRRSPEAVSLRRLLIAQSRLPSPPF